jgi:hypothetical protein
LNGAKYKDKKPYFEISVKLRIFWTPYRSIYKKKIFLTLFSDFLF